MGIGSAQCETLNLRDEVEAVVRVDDKLNVVTATLCGG